ncbi:hypothetical protein QP568_07975 [Propionimicrobium lymphophilum]|uniref:hypothetical protein n=1 Tax=Propionimicrobium lymphophilum TaxID=33012 RepID=UPI00255198F2|nr:hypothetical protein [Propionimicrobium lymphophilum]MDK7710206.1 hypothetical protein [Propionimicrobium lymphophilum]MDK7734221.1 hypothetical protein [Propionimicrobium lymphophilum]
MEYNDREIIIDALKVSLDKMEIRLEMICEREHSRSEVESFVASMESVEECLNRVTNLPTATATISTLELTCARCGHQANHHTDPNKRQCPRCNITWDVANLLNISIGGQEPEMKNPWDLAD